MMPMLPFAPSPSIVNAYARVDKATSEFLNCPDWRINIGICDIINTKPWLSKDYVKALRSRLQHKNPNVQLLSLTLLETMVKNCADHLHSQIAERKILQEMIKIVKKRTHMRVREKILVLIDTWQEAFGGRRGKHAHYHHAYEELRSMRNVSDLLSDMLQAVDPKDRAAVKDEVIVDLTDQCRSNQKKLGQMLASTTNEELLRQSLQFNDTLQCLLEKHDAIASGSMTSFQASSSMNHPSHLKQIESAEVNSKSSIVASAPMVHSSANEAKEEQNNSVMIASSPYATAYSAARSTSYYNNGGSSGEGLNPYIPSYRLFEDLNVLGNLRTSGTAGTSGPSMLGGQK
ncbi:ENTH/VHS-like protein [Cynara cardunculus var. scolymus]|uniref:ENTH/VHS-like protein n=1 Tax=Cynara cardunculus var. scolymus TaxID=59895 RepID=A0A103XQ91_CYNCS|nr:ENTH/VHS-like protein [Cynara cardunculus var. scolymus]